MTREQLYVDLYSPIQQTLQDAVTLALTGFGPGSLEANRDMEKWDRVKIAFDGLIDAFQTLKDPQMPEARALAEIRLRTPALSAIADELDPAGARGSKIIARLHTAQDNLEAGLAAQLTR